jgi:uncharacterized delta-60 repeat protein
VKSQRKPQLSSAPRVDGGVIWGRRGRRRGTRLVLGLIAAACALAAIVAAAAAEDATETSTFGEDGIASQSLGVHFEETQFWTVMARADGGLVAQRDQRVESYLPNGTADPAGPTRQLEKWGRVFALASGKSLVVDDGKLTRVNPDGSIDTSFGGTGTIEWPGGVQAASELTSGKILFAATQVVGTHEMFAQLRLELLAPDGSLERGFGYDGALTFELPRGSTYAPEIAPSGDGGALVTGDGFLLKLRADGTSDPAFGSEGLLGGLPNLVGARLLPDGSVEAVGWDAGSSVEDPDFAVLRLTATGKPDEAFGPGGLRRFDFGSREEANVASWAADGSVVVGGRAKPHGPCPRGGCEEVPVLAAFDPAGNLDPSFGEGGMLELTGLAGAPSSYPDGGVLALTRRPDGSIVAAGSAAPKRTVAFLAALSPTGVLLPGFGEGGIVSLSQPVPASQQLTGFAPLADGKLLAAAGTDLGVDSESVLIRYAADGGLDPTFGGGAGYVTVGSSRFVTGFAAHAGQVLMGLYDTPRSRLLWLNAADGAPVRSFGSDGTVLLPRPVRRLVALGFAEGDAVVLGIRDVAGTAEPGVVLRFHPDGKPDQAFGHNGRMELRLPGGDEVTGGALIAGPGGRILVGGKSGRRFVVTSLLPDGRPDPRFGSDGWSVVGAGGIAKSVTLSRFGSHLYLAGVAAKQVRHPHVVLMRFNDNGRLDSSFGDHGRFTAPISKPAQPKAIVRTGDGVLVVLNGGPKPLLSFGRDGKVRRDWISPQPQFVENVRATASRGRLVLGWNAFSPTIFPHYVNYLSSRPLGSR